MPRLPGFPFDPELPTWLCGHEVVADAPAVPEGELPPHAPAPLYGGKLPFAGPPFPPNAVNPRLCRSASTITASVNTTLQSNFSILDIRLSLTDETRNPTPGKAGLEPRQLEHSPRMVRSKTLRAVWPGYPDDGASRCLYFTCKASQSSTMSDPSNVQ
jgi:hypothetical protein